MDLTRLDFKLLSGKVQVCSMSLQFGDPGWQSNGYLEHPVFMEYGRSTGQEVNKHNASKSLLVLACYDVYHIPLLKAYYMARPIDEGMKTCTLSRCVHKKHEY